MSALADEATKAANTLMDNMQRLWDDVKAAKALCTDPAARDVLTRLQAEMFGLKADAYGLKALISAARQTRYFDTSPLPYQDRKTAAAHDLTLDPENEQ